MRQRVVGTRYELRPNADACNTPLLSEYAHEEHTASAIPEFNQQDTTNALMRYNPRKNELELLTYQVQ